MTGCVLLLTNGLWSTGHGPQFLRPHGLPTDKARHQCLYLAIQHYGTWGTGRVSTRASRISNHAWFAESVATCAHCSATRVLASHGLYDDTLFDATCLRYLQSAQDVLFGAQELQHFNATAPWYYVHNNGPAGLFKAYKWSLDTLTDFAMVQLDSLRSVVLMFMLLEVGSV